MFKQLRLSEMQDSVALLRTYRESGDLLEIGAGTGWQSKALSEAGYRVEAVDLPADSDISNHARSREWPIRDYDGVHLPFPDRSFDIVYSSNVLEHVVELNTLTKEMKRVLRPDGIALHLVPNTNWRLLSLAAYYPAQAIDALRWLTRQSSTATEASEHAATATPANHNLLGKAVRRLVPHAHGSVGTPFTELSRFSKRAWDGYFEEGGWDVLYYGTNGFLASGDYLLGSLLPMSQRRRLGRITGGIAHVYLARPKARR
jgi:2-polyprenyl-3-methyl-5-hydroxy-6-metoxy-1,4-benzoquinol methylase